MPTILTKALTTFVDGSIRRLHKQKITLPQLVAATYLMVAGGPYGLEDIVGRAGYNGAILILLVTPLCWSIPTALMVSELSSRPTRTRRVLHVGETALGPFWGFQEAWLSLVASIFDMAIYPTLVTSYLSRIFPAVGQGCTAMLVSALSLAVCTAVNLRGAKAVGVSSFVFTLLLLSPFTVVIAIASTLPAAPVRNAMPGDSTCSGPY